MRGTRDTRLCRYYVRKSKQTGHNTHEPASRMPESIAFLSGFCSPCFFPALMRGFFHFLTEPESGPYLRLPIANHLSSTLIRSTHAGAAATDGCGGGGGGRCGRRVELGHGRRHAAVGSSARRHRRLPQGCQHQAAAAAPAPPLARRVGRPRRRRAAAHRPLHVPRRVVELRRRKMALARGPRGASARRVTVLVEHGTSARAPKRRWGVSRNVLESTSVSCSFTCSQTRHVVSMFDDDRDRFGLGCRTSTTMKRGDPLDGV